MRPQQVEQISKAAQAPDVPLVPTHALGVDLPVDQDAFLFVEGETLETPIERPAGGDGTRCVGGQGSIFIRSRLFGISRRRRGRHGCETMRDKKRGGNTVLNQAGRAYLLGIVAQNAFGKCDEECVQRNKLREEVRGCEQHTPRTGRCNKQEKREYLLRREERKKKHGPLDFVPDLLFVSFPPAF